jgi:hypothetical protein
MQPMTNKDLEVFVDASFCGDWDPKEAASDRDTARSRHGYIIKYANCPLLWKSQLQTEVALSSTESEYTGLSYALRDAIPIMELLKEMKTRGYPISTTQARVHCRVFEDNSGALEMARVHKYRPRTKHLNVKLHHSRDDSTLMLAARRSVMILVPERTVPSQAQYQHNVSAEITIRTQSRLKSPVAFNTRAPGNTTAEWTKRNHNSRTFIYHKALTP